jgi:integrase
MTSPTKRKRRARGGLDSLPSGAIRVRVYAGIDPMTKKPHYLSETVPPGPDAEALAEKTRTRFLSQIDEQRNPRTRATVNHLMDRYFEVIEVEKTTRDPYERYTNNYIRPYLGTLQVGRIDAEVLDAFYGQLRTCRDNCRGKKRIDHRTVVVHDCRVVRHRRRSEHDCDELGCRVLECRPHTCRPLANSTVRQIHWILSGAFHRAKRWRWVTLNPIELAMPPAAPTPRPKPPSAPEAAQLVNEAWKDPGWGAMVWVAMTSGARRGELCGLRWSDIDLAGAVITLRKSRAQVGREQWEKDTKTHQQRRIALDAETVVVLEEHLSRCAAAAKSIGIKLAPNAFVFSSSPDSETALSPDSVTQRYRRMAARIKIDTTIHALRHFSATELITAGVDIRTVAGRLGHGGGGSTTLRVYAAWVSEADQRAAETIGPRMPARPGTAGVAKKARGPRPKVRASNKRPLAGHGGPI